MSISGKSNVAITSVSQGDPVVSPPAEFAANRPEKKQSQKPVVRALLSGFEFNGFAAGAPST
jgi:hypothetical protein